MLRVGDVKKDATEENDLPASEDNKYGNNDRRWKDIISQI